MDWFYLVKLILMKKWLLQQRSSLCVAFVKTKTSIHSTSFVTWFSTRSLRNWILKDFLRHHQIKYFVTHKTCISAIVCLITFSICKNFGNREDDDDEVMKPNIMTISLSENLPIPCKCGKCARANVCICRVNNI